ncbi:type II toxin-antitoxin system VapC family toxin [Agromyces aerolatus]|uniref:type II toxin-antitoxin system VapC family toxin n=1 Tax=Agromyces sp. LY-1074 TaxID=3074080 RepID=UPI002867965A|nr:MULTISPECIES: type II toxin-antitoxin system VapC family toxin [unclassified Agromyces]MDR5699592.1 type II toxin-antitoxin system VapC family toxin [Agromyces sp. LY-1074]MDR5705888.1 type II toxin-antitoxin system VapC family toxin [Agromyces sp. LY-1358]
MSWLLDTNVVSELRRPVRTSRALTEWAAHQDPSLLFISAMTIVELETGVCRKERTDPLQGAVLRRWLDGNVIPAFEGRTLPVDARVAVRAGSLHVPDPKPSTDALIAATAMVHGLTVVTRNARDFTPLGVPVLNPWSQER